MKNRDKPVHNCEYPRMGHQGLTKLEYAAIHVLAAQISSGRDRYDVESAVYKANLLFDELEKEQETE